MTERGVETTAAASNPASRAAVSDAVSRLARSGNPPMDGPSGVEKLLGASLRPPERPQKPATTRSRQPQDGPKVNGGTLESRRRAALVLEVLAGARSAAEAAEAVGVTLGAYFHVERRALEGLVKGCEPAPKGRQTGFHEKELAKLRDEIRRLEQESARYQALVRVVRGAAGMSIAQVSKKPGKAPARRKSKSRSAVRALKVARSLQKESALPGVSPEV